MSPFATPLGLIVQFGLSVTILAVLVARSIYKARRFAASQERDH